MRVRCRVPAARGCALSILLTLLVAAPSGAALSFEPPRVPRERMEAGLGERDRVLVVYGTRDAAASAALREQAQRMAQRLLGGDSTQVRADREVTEAELRGRHVLLIGSPAQNQWTAALAPALPVEFGTGRFRWFGRDYTRPGDALHLVYPNPLAASRFLLLIAGNSASALTRRGGGFYFGSEDWRVYRDGELVRSGVFAQDGGRPWRYEAALDLDLDRDRERFAASLVADTSAGVRIRAAAQNEDAAAVRTAAAVLLARLDRLGLRTTGRAPSLTLYGSLEQKGLLTRNTRPEHVEADGSAHAARAAGRTGIDLWSVSAQRLIARGASPGSPFLEPAAVWLTSSCEGEPLERAIARIYFGRVLPTAADAAAREREWRSPLIVVPSRALLVRALYECAGARGNAALRPLLVAAPAGTLDSLCAAAGVSPDRVTARYAALGDSLARIGRSSTGRAPRAWRPADGFIGGVCLAHTVRLDGGYLSAACGGELANLKRAGAGWVSLTPFGYLPSTRTPEIHVSAQGGPDEESDEAVCEAGARARALGLRVMLKPHLWTRGWVGELEFTPSGWNRFFERYRAFILHYALLAEREGYDGLFVGHELASATLRFPERWRAMIADVRRSYAGTLTYGANWGEEVNGIAFWDALDLVSVSFYEPLAEKPTTSASALRAGAARALKRLREVAVRTRRPVLLSEVGYAPMAMAPVRPWEERDGAIDLETQRACYDAVTQALEPELWVAGACWWKWFSSPATGGPRDPSFSPRGKPAEAVMRRALSEWQGRPVHLP